jgi:uncharacterized protein YjeT (DUF2065 family)
VCDTETIATDEGVAMAAEMQTQRTSEASRRSGRPVRVVSAAAGAFFALSGIAAFVAPATFFEAAATFEPYNEHFVRDIGAFQLGLGAVLLLSVWIDDASVVALGGVGIGSLFHTVAHAIDHDLGGQPTVDIPFHGAVSIVLLAVAGVRWRSLRRER